MTPSKYWVAHTGFTETMFIEFRASADKPDPDFGWCIERNGWVWSLKNEDFIHEPLPSNRTEEFLKDTRFSLSDAEKYANGILGRTS